MGNSVSKKKALYNYLFLSDFYDIERVPSGPHDQDQNRAELSRSANSIFQLLNKAWLLNEMLNDCRWAFLFLHRLENKEQRNKEQGTEEQGARSKEQGTEQTTNSYNFKSQLTASPVIIAKDGGEKLLLRLWVYDQVFKEFFIEAFGL